MKKLLGSTLLVATGILLVACGDSGSKAVTVSSSSNSAKVTETSETETSGKTETSKEAAVGKRSNPVPLNSTATFDTEYYSENGESVPANISMTISNVMRGEAAYNYLITANQFNEAAPAGKEWLVFDVSMKMNKGSQDVPYFTTASFTPVSSNGEEVAQDTYGTLGEGEEFGYKDLYEGGEQTGKVALLVPTGDETLIEFSDFNSSVFFKLQ